MPDILLAAVEYGPYVSIIKFAVFLAMFFLWLPLLAWVYDDAKSLDTNEGMWTGVVLGAGAFALLAWTVIPVFLVGLLAYLILVGGASLAYVKHRNARVMDFDRVLTVDHIKGLFVSKEKKMGDLQSFIFTTANKNQVPVPEPRTPDFFGYKIAYELLSDAIWRRASTIAFSPGPQEYQVTYSVDGAAVKQPSLARDQVGYLIRFLKSLADLDVKEKRKPQRGKFRTSTKENNHEWELTTAGSTAGEQVRIKNATQEQMLKVPDIGLAPDQLEQVNAFREAGQGLFIVTGPKKSGVTSTFYALLRNHDAFMNSINSLERQPSATLPNITQHTHSPAEAGQTYGQKLQYIVRMGPDVLGVADCEDRETAKIACAAAKDGKIVYVALEAASVTQALAKWIKLVGDKNLVGDVMLGVSNQRMVRKLCAECKQAYAPNQELLRKFNLSAEKTKVLYREGKVQYDKHGKPITCDHCQGTGFIGRTGVFEMVVMNDQLRDIFKQTKSLPEIATQFRRAKMLYLQEQALRKVISGETSINEMIRVLSASKTKQAKPK